MKKYDKKKLNKIIIMGFLLITCILLTYYFHFILKTEIIFTHLFYLPIILASLWWGRKGIIIAVCLAVMLLFLDLIDPINAPIYLDLIRGLMFIVISITTSTLSEKRDQLEDKVAQRNKELQKANLKLQELDQLKSMFIASMSHELRTPLNSIIGFTGIILQGMSGEINQEQRKQLSLVKNSANHLLDLINDVIDISKIEADKVELYIQEFDLASLLQEVKNSFTVTAEEKGLQLFLQTPPVLLIESDERRTKQVLVNFISNALKFTDKGEIKITIVKKDKIAVISVRDSGIGMKKEDMGKLFQAFSRIIVPGRLTEGTGLGLYLSKKIADLLAGNITAESEYGKGSTFTLTLPLKR